MWDEEQYVRFRGERSRPFFDLLARIPDRSYRNIADLGCGTGDLTAALSDHWPEAMVVGVDQSPEMLTRAAKLTVQDRLEFVQGDITTWRPRGFQELIVSNATFQWIPDPVALIRQVTSYLAPNGVLAVQLPDNARSPSQILLRELEAAGPWAEKLTSRRRQDGVLPLARYLELLWAAGLTKIDSWEVTYQHVLEGEDAVLVWMKGTTLRPILTVLAGEEKDRFLKEYQSRLAAAYPRTSEGTLFPFRRLFFVARKA
jgi:trans-aconitate 2-methyltransferase